jgi:hypothetical protein
MRAITSAKTASVAATGARARASKGRTHSTAVSHGESGPSSGSGTSIGPKVGAVESSSASPSAASSTTGAHQPKACRARVRREAASAVLATAVARGVETAPAGAAEAGGATSVELHNRGL